MVSTSEQVDRLVALGLTELKRWTAPAEGLVVVHPSTAPAAELAPLLEHRGKPGFVMPDLNDLDEFVPIDGVDLPDGPAYVVIDPRRGDELANRTPEEALPVLTGEGRSPMTLHEGISWLLQEPGVLDRNHCFMTIGSRKPDDRRTPALWISNGVERDGGRERKDAPKVGWCWAGNRHTWLGFASVATRTPSLLE